MEKDEEALSIATRIALPSVARLVYMGELKRDERCTMEDIINCLKNLGKDDAHAFQMYHDRPSKIFRTIDTCIENKDYGSAVILVFTCIEAEINAAIRLLLSVRNFSNKKVEETLSGADIKTKVNVILPLMGISAPEPTNQIINECKSVRNSLVHFKAAPSIFTDSIERAGDHVTTNLKAGLFFEKWNISDLKDIIGNLFNDLASECEYIIEANDLLNMATQQAGRPKE